METTRTVISKAQKRKKGILTEMVVYKTVVGKKNGKPVYHSSTKHESI